MNAESFVRLLDDPHLARDWLYTRGVSDSEQAHRQLVAIASAGIPLDLVVGMVSVLEQQLGCLSDPELAIDALAQFLLGARSPLAVATLFERDPESLVTFLLLCSSSRKIAELLVRDSESFDLIRMTDGQPVTSGLLRAEIDAELEAFSEEARIVPALRRFQRREFLRIAYGEIIKLQSPEVVMRQLSWLAEAICEAAFRTASRRVLRDGPKHAEFDVLPGVAVIALGKLGGVELDYANDLELLFVGGRNDLGDSRDEGADGRAELIVRTMLRFLQEGGDEELYKVDLRHRPGGAQAELVCSLDSAVQYFEASGRTWDRQAFVKARCVAGDRELGREFLQRLEPWVYQRYLSRADVTGIKALKRRIGQPSESGDSTSFDIRTAPGGIRDIETVIQFLQLLNGGDLPQIRATNTLEAIEQLERAGCLTAQERLILTESYPFLRRVEHRLQVMFDARTAALPVESAELRKLAIRCGYAADAGMTLSADIRGKASKNRSILDRLLHDAFTEEAVTESESDLVLDPEPSALRIRDVLSPYGFRDLEAAYRRLSALAIERIPFLSTRRCRHFLAVIARRLLQSIAQTPDPDMTIAELARVSDSLGGKGVLWELFRTSEPSLQLYVRLCAACNYLSAILTSNPGMIDELMDSLVLDKLPTMEWQAATLDELCRGAEDLDPILHSFKNAMHLRVGVRDVLGKESLEASHRVLADVAEVCLQRVTLREYYRLVEKYGEPMIEGTNRDGLVCEFIILGMGKLGGREPNYHSDLDVLFLYEAEGATQQRHRGRRDTTTSNQHFFSQLGQRVIRTITQIGPWGRLYELDTRLRPSGSQAAIAVSLDEFHRHFRDGAPALSERQALCKARPVYGSDRARDLAMRTVRNCLWARPWSAGDGRELRDLRRRLEESASTRNLKRAPGGTLDVEFIVQGAQLQLTRQQTAAVVPGTLDALNALVAAQALPAAVASKLSEAYRFLRRVEARLRLLDSSARHDLPNDHHELARLAFLLQCPSPESLAQQCDETMRQTRLLFEQLTADWSGE
ncbi:MAG: bifunctional [glutamate--ammonia ligase]-adenylyl-L-tyrosine phosphorylase/[glutamate--ammonia-ligase] adenylyltransferase [Planctomycetes bacterium]|nr:bifunctional [glutamate--ammonia ligase]-adenylyl-L-tyrosine phosphorylase/[glutamate--ammonia-ligase] adenylyltransferase [Planctomycetota bacterium]